MLLSEHELIDTQRSNRIRHDKKQLNPEVLGSSPGISNSNYCSEAKAYFSNILNSDAAKFEDPVFVSLDTEGFHIREIEFCILDTRNLKFLSLRSDLSSILSNHNLILFQTRLKEKRQFKFGTSQRLDPRWIRWTLNKLLRTGSLDEFITEPRNIILVGHSISTDLQRLSMQHRGNSTSTTSQMFQ